MKLGQINLDGSGKALVPCRRCECAVADIYPPVGGQPGFKLICADCDSFHAWLSPTHPKAPILPSGHPPATEDDDVIDMGDLFE